MINRTHRYNNKIISALMAALLCLGPLQAAAFATEEDYIDKRSESVYVDLAADGVPLTMVSSVYLTNTDKSDALEDLSSLTDVKNVLGNEKPQIDGDRIIFAADGDDVCYQGTAHGELPVYMEISYTLDGKAMSAEEISGKSGRAGIHIKSFNRDRHSALIDGENVELYTPFSVICVMTLNDGFSMIECDNGRVSSEAGTVNVMAMLHPGLKESLGMLESDTIHSNLNLWADTSAFSLESIMFVVMTGLVDEENISSIDDVQELIDGIDELSDATDELYDGASEMKDGINEYVDGMREFSDGLQEFRDGLEEYAGGVTELFFGIKELNNGAGKLTTGAWEINSGVASLEAGLMQAATDSSGAVEFTDQTMQTIKQLCPGISQIELATIETVIKNAFKSANTAQMTQLLSAVSKLKKGTEEYAAGVAQFRGGVGKLADGGLEIVGATGELRDGVLDLQEGAEELDEGAVEICDGAQELTDGIAEFRDEGVNEMRDQTENIRISLSRKDALLALSDSYRSFSSTDPNVSGNVQFILTTEDIIPEKPIESSGTELEGKTEDEIELIPQEKEQSWWSNLWGKIRSWFAK